MHRVAPERLVLEPERDLWGVGVGCPAETFAFQIPLMKNTCNREPHSSPRFTVAYVGVLRWLLEGVLLPRSGKGVSAKRSRDILYPRLSNRASSPKKRSTHTVLAFILHSCIQSLHSLADGSLAHRALFPRRQDDLVHRCDKRY
jgi:hypothetical protein